MYDINDFEIYPDYPLKDDIGGFYNYLFSLTKTQENKHATLKYDVIDFVVAGEAYHISAEEKDARESAKTAFEETLKVSGTRPSELASILIDFSPAEYEIAFEDLQLVMGVFDYWCKETGHFGVLVSHMTQDNRLPHVHILMQKDKDNEFQEFLADALSKFIEEQKG